MIARLNKTKQKVEKFELPQAFSKHVIHQNFVLHLTPAIRPGSARHGAPKST